MTDNEKLILDAAITIREADGALSHGEAMLYASAALAVFEKAHTPTDDERELSERLVSRHLPLSAPSDTAANIVRHLTEVGLFRNSEVPEPSAEVEFPFTLNGVTIEQEDGGLWITVDEHDKPRWLGPRALAALRAAGGV